MNNNIITEFDIDIKFPGQETFKTTVKISGECYKDFWGNHDKSSVHKVRIVSSVKMFDVEVGLDSKIHQAAVDYMRDMK